GTKNGTTTAGDSVVSAPAGTNAPAVATAITPAGTQTGTIAAADATATAPAGTNAPAVATAITPADTQTADTQTAGTKNGTTTAGDSVVSAPSGTTAPAASTATATAGTTSVSADQVSAATTAPYTKTIAVTFTDFDGDSCIIRDFLLGSDKDIELYLHHKDNFAYIMLIIIAFLIVITLFACLMLTIKRIPNMPLNALLFFLCNSFIWVLTNFQSVCLLPIHPEVVFFIRYSTYMMLPTAISSFAFHILTDKKKKFMRVMNHITLASAAMQMILYFTGTMTMYDMQHATDILIGVTMTWACMLQIVSYLKHRTRNGMILSWILVATEATMIVCFIAYAKSGGFEYINEFTAGILIVTVLAVIVFGNTVSERFLDNKKTETEVSIYKKLSVTDALTGLWNRREFDSDMEDIQSETITEALLFVFDLNDLKEINDTLGHGTGDEVIIAAGKCIRKAFGAEGKCYRTGGDEFAAIIKDPMQTADFYSVKVKAVMAEMQLAGQARLSIAVGYSYLFNKIGLKRRNTLWLSIADRAMYSDKLRMKMIPKKPEDVMDEFGPYIIKSLDAALDKGDIQMWIQPQYDYFTGEMVGGEALCRWNSDLLGWISPAEFIPVLERTGLIKKLDRFMWTETCSYMHEHRRKFGGDTIPLAVNVSRVDIADGDTIDILEGLLEKYELTPADLKIEITESAYVEKPDVMMDFVNKLHEKGFLVIMDDFGSGFSSLSTLKEVPIDVIKLGMEFLTGEDSHHRGSRILGGVIRMAGELGIPVIAEGVETYEQARFLGNLGCSTMQGYYFARPLPKEEFSGLLAEEHEVPGSTRSELHYTGPMEDINNPNVISIVLSEYYLDGDMYITKVDENFTKLTGYTPADIAGKKINQMELIPETDRVFYLRLVNDMLTKYTNINLSHHILRKDGTSFDVYCEGVQYLDNITGEIRSRIRLRTTKDNFIGGGSSRINNT
ncbi:MAG: EAL domain-containing protein, partial [Parasporobacterium sp.]|nr:EAL domain-containing protein [Parasporobacterium sp.]